MFPLCLKKTVHQENFLLTWSLIMARFFRSFLSVALVAFVVSPLVAEDEKWISLFDGKSLTGWHKNPEKIGHGTGGIWKVEEGVITGEQDPPGSGNGGILLTDRKFKNFEVQIDLKPDWGICSGFFVRSNDKGQCIQMMVDYHDAGNVGHIYGEGTGGFNNRPYEIFGKYDDKMNLLGLEAKPNGAKVPEAYSISPEEWVKLWKINDWNTAKVRVVGSPPVITTWINGTKVSEFNGNTYDGASYDKAKVSEITAEGSIAVQVHGGKSWPAGAKCRWKNIKVRELGDDAQ